jgi:hypothetical protein
MESRLKDLCEVRFYHGPLIHGRLKECEWSCLVCVVNKIVRGAEQALQAGQIHLVCNHGQCLHWSEPPHLRTLFAWGKLSPRITCRKAENLGSGFTGFRPYDGQGTKVDFDSGLFRNLPVYRPDKGFSRLNTSLG